MNDSLRPQPARLYHAPMACSTAVRIAAAAGNVPLDVIEVSLRTHTLADGTDYYGINPLGQVSVLQLPDGSFLTETLACLLWVQSHGQDTGFRCAADNPDYYQLIRWLSFVSTELHKQIFRIVFYDEASERVKDNIRALGPDRLKLLDNHLGGREWLLGEAFTSADAYLVWALLLADKAGLNASPYRHLARYHAQALARPEIAAIIADDRARKTALQ